MVRTIQEQIEELETEVEMLWWIAELEAGIERSSLDREPKFGSRTVIQYITQEFEWDNNEGRTIYSTR